MFGIRNIYNQHDSNESVYPNPTTGDLTISGLDIDGEISVEVVNSLGQTIRSLNSLEVSSGSVQLSLSGMAAGAYFIRIIKDQHVEQYVKVIKK